MTDYRIQTNNKNMSWIRITFTRIFAMLLLQLVGTMAEHQATHAAVSHESPRPTVQRPHFEQDVSSTENEVLGKQQFGYERPQPYDFGYTIQDEYGNTQFRTEQGDSSGTVQGTYGYTDAYGIYRRVGYIADANGFRAEVKSNEPGVKADHPADVFFNVEETPRGVIDNVGRSNVNFRPSSGSSGQGRQPPATRNRFTPFNRGFPNAGSASSSAAKSASASSAAASSASASSAAASRRR